MDGEIKKKHVADDIRDKEVHEKARKLGRSFGKTTDYAPASTIEKMPQFHDKVLPKLRKLAGFDDTRNAKAVDQETHSNIVRKFDRLHDQFWRGFYETCRRMGESGIN